MQDTQIDTTKLKEQYDQAWKKLEEANETCRVAYIDADAAGWDWFKYSRTCEARDKAYYNMVKAHESYLRWSCWERRMSDNEIVTTS